MPYPEKKVDPKDIVTKKVKSNAEHPDTVNGTNYTVDPNAPSTPNGPTHFEHDPQGPDGDNA